jgi:hypothetical protein
MSHGPPSFLRPFFPFFGWFFVVQKPKKNLCLNPFQGATMSILLNSFFLTLCSALGIFGLFGRNVRKNREKLMDYANRLHQLLGYTLLGLRVFNGAGVMVAGSSGPYPGGSRARSKNPSKAPKALGRICDPQKRSFLRFHVLRAVPSTW